MQESQQLFYLGKDDKEALTLYKSKDLTTHALIIGMTGSGKTGLGVGLIEEAAIDGIPSIVIDPKGDMGNLLLAFPEMSAEEFKPWIDSEEAANKGQTIDEMAASTAKQWSDGLQSWDEDKGRVALLKSSAEFTIYTPAASHGVGVNILSSFKAPSKEVLEDTDTLNMLISSSATSILSLIGINADPLSSKEHILLSSIFARQYQEGKNVSLEEIITLIVTPPFDKVGVFSLETFFPKEKRMDFAMKLNAIVASPTFASWLEGESMDIDAFLYNSDKKPKVSIFNIAHLSDNERMFFVTLLLNSIIAWMRSQDGSANLRALIYMDEIFGYFPPNSNPSSKLPMLTLLKQARAFGLGVVLSTQNPVDLDYKGLSNIGTWFIGRLQTAQDKERVIEGLLGIKGSEFNKQELFELISNLKKRHFLLKNINDEGLKVFQTRWTLVYLKGPLSRDQIKLLSKEAKAKIQNSPKITSAANAQIQDQTPSNESATNSSSVPSAQNSPNVNFVSTLKQYYFYESSNAAYRMRPYLICSAKVRFISSKQGINKEQILLAQTPIVSASGVKWEMSDILGENLLETMPRQNSSYDDIAPFIDDSRKLDTMKKEAEEFIARSAKLSILSVPDLKMEAGSDESETSFKTRVEAKLDEIYNQKYEELKELYDKKHKVIEDKFSKLTLRLDKEKDDVQNKTLDTITSVGSGILGMFLGRGKLGSISRTASGVKNANKMLKERGDVKRVEQEMEEVQQEAQAIESEFQNKVKALREEYSIGKTEFGEVVIVPRKSDVYDEKLYIVWREI